MDAKSYFTTPGKNEGTHMRTFVFWFLAFLGLLGIDQLSKWIAFRYTDILPFSESFGLTQFKNDKFAFSLAVPLPIAYAVYGIVLGIIARYVYKNHARLSLQERWAWALVLSGGVSNVLERLFIGYVRDFIQVPNGAVINFADLFIIVGIILLLATEFGKSRQKA